MFYNLTNKDGEATLALISEDGTFNQVLDGSHPNFTRIVAVLATGEATDDEVKRLSDPASQIADDLAAITDRMVYRDNNLFFDGLPLNNSLGRHLLNMLENGDTDVARFVKFAENLDENPSYHAQQAVFQWIDKHGLTITEDGCFLGFKAVQRDFLSSSSGPANFVDGVLLANGANVHVPHKVGSVISKKRADVDDRPGGGCSVGLHVGTESYARSFGPVQVTVKVNPRDVVSAPSNDSEYKIRVCSYEVISMNDPAQFAGTSYDTADVPVVPVGLDITTVEGQVIYAKANPIRSDHHEWDEGQQAEYDSLVAAGRSLYDNLRTQFGWSHHSAVETAAAEFPAPEPVDDEPEVEDPDAGAVEAGIDARMAETARESIAVSFDGSPVSVRLFVPEKGKDAPLADWAAENDVLRRDLEDRNQGHKPLARKWADVTTEASVRRYRKAKGISLSLGTKVKDALS